MVLCSIAFVGFPHFFQTESRIGFLVGLVAEEKFEAFERLLYRATRGKLFLSQVRPIFLFDTFSQILINYTA